MWKTDILFGQDGVRIKMQKPRAGRHGASLIPVVATVAAREHARDERTWKTAA
jgi:hypothetical protein